MLTRGEVGNVDEEVEDENDGCAGVCASLDGSDGILDFIDKVESVRVAFIRVNDTDEGI